MNQAFYTGVVGMQAHQQSLDVVADNLANINTVGFRGSQTEFASIFEEVLGTSSAPTTDSIGQGVRVQSTTMMMQQGSLLLADRNTDLAIEGDGWFGISGNGETLYTRAGAFGFDSERSLVSGDGHYVLGTMGNNFSDGVITEQLDAIAIADVAAQESLLLPDTLEFPVQPSTLATFSGNLGTDDILRSVSANVISPSSEHNRLRLDFTQIVPQPSSGSAWDIVGTTTNNNGEIVYDTQNGSAIFDESGGLLSFTMPALDNDGTPVDVDLGSGFTGVVSNVSETEPTLSSDANGFEGGDLLGYRINENADIIAGFSNGRSSAVGKIALYHFQNDQGLNRINGSRFQESANSGKPIFYQDVNGNNVLGANIHSGRLEGANVSMDQGLTELIILQRSFDANSKSVTTGDELIQKALNMDG